MYKTSIIVFPAIHGHYFSSSGTAGLHPRCYRHFARQLPTSVNTLQLLRKQTIIGTTNFLIAEKQ
jgi:hypothetical protein